VERPPISVIGRLMSARSPALVNIVPVFGVAVRLTSAPSGC
jgi:hypothetical protein